MRRESPTKVQGGTPVGVWGKAPQKLEAKWM